MNKHVEHLDLAELSTLYQSQLEVINEMERKYARLEEIANGLFVISEPGPVKHSLWRKYQQLKRPKPQEPLEGISGI